MGIKIGKNIYTVYGSEKEYPIYIQTNLKNWNADEVYIFEYEYFVNIFCFSNYGDNYLHLDKQVLLTRARELGYDKKENSIIFVINDLLKKLGLKVGN